MKRTIRLTESQLNKMIKEAVEDAMQSNDLDIDSPHKSYEKLFDEGHKLAEEFRQMANNIANLIPRAYTNGAMGELGVKWQFKLEDKMKEIRNRYFELTSEERR